MHEEGWKEGRTQGLLVPSQKTGRRYHTGARDSTKKGTEQMKKQTATKGKSAGKPMMMDQKQMMGKGQMKGMTGKKPGKY